jgi:acetyltransferase-like isoleucine patch superfamily enzyme
MVKERKINSLPVITILGYRGSYLALIFENLAALGYIGRIEIIINEDEKKAVAPFETNIPFAELFYTEIKVPNERGFIFCSNKPSTKQFLYEFYFERWKFKRNGFEKLIHPSCVISSSTKIDSGIQMEPLSVLAPYSKIGFGVNIGRNCSIGHHTTLKDFCSVYFGSNVAGRVKIEKNTTIGPGTTIFEQVRIGENTIIGGGSVVTRDIPSNVLAFGNPCKVIKELN